MSFKANRQARCSPARRARAWSIGALAAAGSVAIGALVGGAFAAQSPAGLGTAGSFAVLAGSTVTNTGPSTITGDLGVSPGTAVTGFPPGTVNGSIHAADAVAALAQSDLTTAYNDAASRTPAVPVSGDLGGLTLTPGVYKASSSIGLTGPLTLDAQGNTSAVFIFQVGSTLTTASASHVNLINGAQACNVFWQIGSSATLGTASVFAGDILALTSISVNNGVTVNGSVLARNGAVTLINDTISAAHCASGTGSGTSGSGTGSGSSGSGSPGTSPAGTGGGNGAAVLATVPRSVARTGTSSCERGSFRAAVTGLLIRKVTFLLGNRVISTRSKPPFEALVTAAAGIHTVTAHVTFTDHTRTATLRFRIRACAAAKRTVSPSRPPRTTSGFTG
ncbi:MAG: ice-binding family protein [Solirubrobacteraceae bacterium]